MHNTLEFILFFLSLIFVLFLPGYFFLLAIFKKNISRRFCQLEVFVLSVPISIVLVDFLTIFINKIGFSLNKISVFIFITLLLAAFYAFYFFANSKKETKKVSEKKFPFTKNQTILIVLILFATIFIKTNYLTESIFPTSTDLGHHMYWAKLVSETGNIPAYAKNEIVEIDGHYAIESNPIADFIIGEHLIFADINLLSGISFVSYFPTLILFSINIFGILAMFILAWRLFENFPFPESKLFNSANLAIFTLLLVGPLYAISSPQAKYVSGGVIGNLIGNLLIPAMLYFYFRAIREKDSWLFFTGLFLSARLFYTHHLSGFIFLFVLFFIFIFFLIFSATQTFLENKTHRLKNIFANYREFFRDLFKTVFSIQSVAFIFFISFFLLFVYTPSYLATGAQSTVVGAPSKSTRAGLSLADFKYAVGEMRFIIGALGFLILFFLNFAVKKSKEIKNDYQNILSLTIISGWLISIFLMTTQPKLLHINIPTNRIANYANFPFTITAAFGIIYFLFLLRELYQKNLISQKISLTLSALVILTSFFLGIYDNTQSLSTNSNIQPALQTFHASEFLAGQINSQNSSANFLKDHNYITADAWIKLFFMQDYNFPLSRSYFKRYEDPTKPREMCTLWMISEPSSQRAQQCFDETGTQFIMIDTASDEPQFKNNSEFSKIYQNKSISLFYRK